VGTWAKGWCFPWPGHCHGPWRQSCQWLTIGKARLLKFAEFGQSLRNLVDLVRFELTTSSMPFKKYQSLADVLAKNKGLSTRRFGRQWTPRTVLWTFGLRPDSGTPVQEGQNRWLMMPEHLSARPTRHFLPELVRTFVSFQTPPHAPARQVRDLVLFFDRGRELSPQLWLQEHVSNEPVGDRQAGGRSPIVMTR
jgi:hypothetical protein